MSRRGLLDRHVALPGDHGSWVFLLGPLLIGLFAGGRWSIVCDLPDGKVKIVDKLYEEQADAIIEEHNRGT